MHIHIYIYMYMVPPQFSTFSGGCYGSVKGLWLSLYVFSKFLVTNLYKSTQDNPQKLIRLACYSSSCINTLREENLGNQAKRDYDFIAATVKLGFRGRKW